jgi:hypothetical protein
MKKIILIPLFLISAYCYALHLKNMNTKYSIAVWNYNYSMAYTMYYHIDNDSLVVKRLSGIKEEKDSVLIERKINKDEQKVFIDFLSSQKIFTLKNKYSNPLVDDGDRKKIVVRFGSRTKTLEVTNFYQKDIGRLIDIINQTVNKDLYIDYRK